MRLPSPPVIIVAFLIIAVSAPQLLFVTALSCLLATEWNGQEEWVGSLLCGFLPLSLRKISIRALQESLIEAFIIHQLPIDN